MDDKQYLKWEKRLVSPEMVFEKIRPGMRIFIGTGVAEPRTLVKHLMKNESGNLQDLELIQLVSMGEAVSLSEMSFSKFRLKTFFSGWIASEAITKGRVDLIPCRFYRIPQLIESGKVSIDAAFVQVTPPDEAGYCSLGVAVDVARQAMDQAYFVVGEINDQMPVTYGDTFVHISEFDLLVKSNEAPMYFCRWPEEEVFDKIAANVASVIDDGSCINFSIGPLFASLAKHLVHKRHLGIHSPFFTDALMDLVKSGAVTNRKKGVYQGKSLTSHAIGTEELMSWLDRNPIVEFQGLDKVFDPITIGSNPRFVAILPARKADLTGMIALHAGKGKALTSNPAETMSFVNGAELSAGGLTVFALPCRNRLGKSNILISLEQFENLFTVRESVDLVVTEYGVADLKGRTVRERAQSLIDVAHPDDRKKLVEQAKQANILYQDQIFLAESAKCYPSKIGTIEIFKDDLTVRFRAIKPSDEEEMRRLFYRFSDKAVYYRYFSPVTSMPHKKMQEYVNVDYNQIMSIVGLTGESGHGKIIAEARSIREKLRPWAEVAFIVDEEYQKTGLATYMYKMLIRLAKENGLQGFTAEVLASNKAMIKVFEKGGMVVKATLEQGVYSITIPF